MVSTQDLKEFLRLAEEKMLCKNWEEMVYYINIVFQNIPDQEPAQKEVLAEIGVSKESLELLWREAYSEGGQNIVIPKIPWGSIPQRIETLKRFLKSAEMRMEEGKPSAAVPLLEVVIQGTGRIGVSYEAMGTTKGHVLDLLQSACEKDS